MNSIGLYASDFMKMSTYMDPFGEGTFTKEWTVFYWGWWLAFMPMMGMFVGKISRGRTIRNVMWGQLLWRTLGCCVSFTIFGGYSLYLQQSGIVDLAHILETQGQSAAIIAILETLPMAKVMMIFLRIVCFIYLAVKTISVLTGLPLIIIIFILMASVKKCWRRITGRISRIRFRNSRILGW